MAKKMTKEEKEKIAKKWIQDHGAASFDLEKGDIILGDGGLFSIEKKDVMVSKDITFKDLPHGGAEVIFSEEKIPGEDFDAWMWFEDLDETISYLQSMKRMLNKLGYKTSHTYEEKDGTSKVKK
jgi:hypothetical protein